jgi:3-hydroxybutyryl-CoA dehydrogenase
VNDSVQKTAAPLDLDTEVAVIGAGAMGAGIAQIAAAAGHRTKIFDAKPGTAEAAIAGIAGTLEKLAGKGRITPNDAAAATRLLQSASSLDECKSAGLVVEAIVENLDVKRKVLAEVEAVVCAECIIASNTSSISITAIGAGLKRPQRLLGMHFFNPAPVMELVEIVSGLATDPAVAETIYATAVAWRKVPVHTRSTPGFIVNRVARPFYAEALRLLNEQAASPATIDAIMKEAGGFRMGPFELMDLIGHDVNYAVTRSVFEAYYNDPRFTPSLIQKELVDAGFLGRKSGRGFYLYGAEVEARIPTSEPPEPVPRRAALAKTGPLTNALAKRLSGKIEFDRGLANGSRDEVEVDGATLGLTDGSSATQRANESGRNDLVVIDLALDYATATRVGLSRADQCSEAAYRATVGLLQAAGFAVSPLKDVPGMAVMRTVAMLANEAADAVDQAVCTATDVDSAMRKGVNYPRGPLAWADSIGLAAVQEVLDNLARHYGEDRYRTSSLIRRCVYGGRGLHAQ